MTTSTRVRAGILQWPMRDEPDTTALVPRLFRYLDVLAEAGCRLAVLPEFFTVPMLAEFQDLPPRGQLERLAGVTPLLVDKIAEAAARLDLWVVAGSLPVLEGGSLRNRAWVLAPDGSRYVQDKIHTTPNERELWGIEGGDALTLVETPFGRLGVLVCYDIEFPELGRLLHERGVDILCVPSWTDTRAAWLRVRLCAQARAIEDECYVLVSGSTGVLTGIAGVDSQYSQAAVFTPSDIPFPHNAVLAEADANVEQYLLADLDIGLLRQLRARGTVRNGRDRRPELYGRL